MTTFQPVLEVSDVESPLTVRAKPSRSKLRSAATLLALFASAGSAQAQGQIWIEQYGSTSWDRSSALIADGAGGVFAAGTTGGDFGGPHAGATDPWLGRFDAAGDLVWSELIGTIGSDEIRACAPDTAGGVFAVGFTAGDLGGPKQGQSDAFVARYDGAGGQVWIRQFALPSPSPSFLASIATAAAPDGAGGVFVAGYTLNQLGGQGTGYNDLFLARYDADGNELWQRVFGTDQGDGLAGAASDGAGGVFLTGYTTGALGGPNAGIGDAWVARYDSAGNEVWSLQLGTTLWDEGTAICADTVGGFLIVGETRGEMAGPGSSNGLVDIWIARYGAAGNQKWIRQIGTNTLDDAMICAEDGSGGCFVGGETRGALGGPKFGNVDDSDAWLARYDREGDQLWIKQVGTSSAERAFGAASDGAQGVVLFGQTGGVLGASSNGGPDDVFLARYDGQCQPGKTYCTSLPTSGGCLPTMDSDGVASLAKPGAFVIRAEALQPGQLGLAFFGTTGPASLPFLGGTMCVGSPIYRLGAAATGGSTACSGTLAYPLSALLAHPAGSLLTPGTAVHCQAWFRDPPSAFQVGLTNGLTFTVCN